MKTIHLGLRKRIEKCNIPVNVHVLILGGGFGGLYAARALAARAPADGRVAVTLVERADAFVFKPLLYELLTDEVAEEDVSFPYAEVLEGTSVEWLRADVREVDLDARLVRLLPAEGSIAPIVVPPELRFDAAAIALGSEPDFRGLPGLAEHALTAATLDDFRDLRRHLARLEEGPSDPRRRTIAICGAGPSGVETACKLADRFVARGGRPPWRVLLVEASPTLLPGFGEETKARALALLREKGVEVLLATPVRGADAQGLALGAGDGVRLPTATIVWTAGQRPSGVVRALPAEHDPGGRLLVPATLELEGREAIFALGDNAHCATEGLEAPPATAQVAVQQAATVARNLLARLDGRTLSSFRYFPLAETLSCGRSYDMFSVLGIRLEGRPANLARRLAYIARLPGWRQKLTAGARWGVRLAADALGAGLDAARRLR